MGEYFEFLRCDFARKLIPAETHSLMQKRLKFSSMIDARYYIFELISIVQVRFNNS